MDVMVQKREPAVINIAGGQNIPLTTRTPRRLMVRDGGSRHRRTFANDEHGRR
jgi:hypothetical protein